MVEIPEAVFRHCELIEEGKPYREFVVLAELVNRCPVRRGP
jgi:hypothetical protein